VGEFLKETLGGRQAQVARAQARHHQEGDEDQQDGQNLQAETLGLQNDDDGEQDDGDEIREHGRDENRLTLVIVENAAGFQDGQQHSQRGTGQDQRQQVRAALQAPGSQQVTAGFAKRQGRHVDDNRKHRDGEPAALLRHAASEEALQVDFDARQEHQECQADIGKQGEQF